MQTFDGPADAGDAVRNWIILNQGAIPAYARDRLVALTRTGTSPLDMIVGFVHTVFANRPAFSDEAKNIAGGVADLCDRSGYYGRLNEEAPALAQALWRDAGNAAPSSGPWPTADKDPAPRKEFEPPEPAPEDAPVPAKRPRSKRKG